MDKEPAIGPTPTLYRRFGKRFLDLALALVALFVLAPLILITALMVRFRLGAHVLFRQERPGQNEKPFTVVKFRTMADGRDESGMLLPDEDRITSFGRFLRSTSLDELPQLMNVVRGEMSLVGPRPLLTRYLPLYSERQARRHEVRPGLTGWSQINGRNAIDWPQRLELDVWYVDHLGLLLDLRILSRTFRQVFQRAGISQPGSATMPEFRGEPSSGAMS